jgi:predicted metallopeptidase
MGKINVFLLSIFVSNVQCIFSHYSRQRKFSRIFIYSDIWRVERKLSTHIITQKLFRRLESVPRELCCIFTLLSSSDPRAFLGTLIFLVFVFLPDYSKGKRYNDKLKKKLDIL